jgi:ribosomal protein S18 acetylase RimI-like enzyme
MLAPPEIVIRHAVPADVPGVAQLVHASFPQDRSDYAGNIYLPGECVNVVATSQVAGTAGFASMLIEATPERGPEEWRKYPLYIGVMAVHLGLRRQGIGTRMLGLLACAAQMRATSHRWMHLHVDQGNEAAIRCFEKFGFERAGGYFSEGVGRRSWLMRKSIRPRLADSGPLGEL